MAVRQQMPMRSGGVIQKAAATSAVANGQKGNSFQSLLKSMMPGIKNALPSVITPERFVRICTSAVSRQPELAENPMSLIGAIMTCAELGLEPNNPLGLCYLIPRRNKGNMEAHFELGYRGMIELANRSGEVSLIQAHTVHENDEFTYELGTDPKIKHIPALKDRGEVIAYYAMFRTKDGAFGFEVMSKQEVEAHAKRYSMSYAKGYTSPWTTSFDEMAKKTCLKKCLKFAPLKTEFRREMAADETVRTSISADFMDDIVPVEQEVIPVDPATGEIESAPVNAPAAEPEG